MFTDFQYGEEMLSDYGLTVCSFDSSGGLETVSPGSQLTFNTIRPTGSDRFYLYGAQYNDVYTVHFQCCKMNRKNIPEPITPEEFSQLNRWLNRRDRFLTFQVNADGYENIHFFGSFNIQAIKINEIMIGLECSFTSNAPYGYGPECCYELHGKQFTVFDSSDEIGEAYPITEITCLEAGDLQITNSLDNEILVIQNCAENETILLDNEHKIITTTNAAHAIANDFNYNYLKIINRYGERNNTFTSSLKLRMVLRYSPIRKVGI